MRALPAGFRIAGVKAGIKASGNRDVALIVADGPCVAAGTFTTNRVAAAPVVWDRAIVPAANIRAVAINAGNANAATGERGRDDVRRTAERVASKIGCLPKEVLVASTGVIGVPLPMDKLEAGLDLAHAELGDSDAHVEAAAHAIMTTDTRPKRVALVRDLPDGPPVSLVGIAKGAAMIAPRMATMLGFLLTDAPVGKEDLDMILHEAVDASFNCLSVEGHTSTNDTVLILARPSADRPPLKGASLDGIFRSMVFEACEELAKRIADDAEGATHRVEVVVEGCATRDEAARIARAVSDSPLVKTAIAGADPNWGRIVSAAGYAGVPFNESEMSLALNGFPLYQAGTPVPFDADEVSRSIRANRDVRVKLTFTRGEARVRFWTCDLTQEYVRLNSDYTT